MLIDINQLRFPFAVFRKFHYGEIESFLLAINRVFDTILYNPLGCNHIDRRIGVKFLNRDKIAVTTLYNAIKEGNMPPAFLNGDTFVILLVMRITPIVVLYEHHLIISSQGKELFEEILSGLWRCWRWDRVFAFYVEDDLMNKTVDLGD